jgi:hypothetical protein
LNFLIKYSSLPKLAKVLIFSIVSIATLPPSSLKYFPFVFEFNEALPEIRPETKFIGMKRSMTRANFQLIKNVTIIPKPRPFGKGKDYFKLWLLIRISNRFKSRFNQNFGFKPDFGLTPGFGLKRNLD